MLFLIVQQSSKSKALWKSSRYMAVATCSDLGGGSLFRGTRFRLFAVPGGCHSEVFRCMPLGCRSIRKANLPTYLHFFKAGERKRRQTETAECRQTMKVDTFQAVRYFGHRPVLLVF